MYSINLINNSGVLANLLPNGSSAGGVTRYIEVAGYPLPIVIADIGTQKISGNPPHTWGVSIFDGQNTNFLGYEGNGLITVTLAQGGLYSAQSSTGESFNGKLVSPSQAIPASLVQDFNQIVSTSSSDKGFSGQDSLVKRYTAWAFEKAGLTPDVRPGLHQGLALAQLHTPGADMDDQGFQTDYEITQLGRTINSHLATSSGFLSVINGFTNASLVIGVHDTNTGNLLAVGSNENYGEQVAFLDLQTNDTIASPITSDMTAVLAGTYSVGGSIIVLQPQTFRLTGNWHIDADPVVAEPVMKTFPSHPLNKIIIGLGRGAGNAGDVDYWFNKNDPTNLSYCVPLVGAVKFDSPIATPLANNLQLEMILTRKDTGGTKPLSTDALKANFSIYNADPTVLIFNLPSGDQDVSTPYNITLQPSAGGSLPISIPVQQSGGSATSNPINFGQLNWTSDINCDLYCRITVNLSGQSQSVYTYIISKDTQDNNPQDGMLYIQPLDFVFHCLAEGTKILLANGNELNIEKLTADHEVLLGDSGKLNMRANVVGKHKGFAYRLRVGDRELVMSEGHAVMTSAGPVRAKDLAVGGEVLVNDGKDTKLDKIKEISRIDYDGYFWNLMLGGHHEQDLYDGRTTMFANGILVGDHQLMVGLKRSRNRDPNIVRQSIDKMYSKDYESWLQEKSKHKN